MSQQQGPADQTGQSAAVRRVVGIAALRRLRRMVDEDQAHEAGKLTRARYVLIWILIAAAFGLIFVLRHIIFA
ncbi:MAG TPA: hypothetical protein VL381_02550 [Rhodocyclaceae bacterium]|jgi:hypothetical protein|nr:hypothetical protein [Rhodocyclaceae bacterium]